MSGTCAARLTHVSYVLDACRIETYRHIKRNSGRSGGICSDVNTAKEGNGVQSSSRRHGIGFIFEYSLTHIVVYGIPWLRSDRRVFTRHHAVRKQVLDELARAPLK